MKKLIAKIIHWSNPKHFEDKSYKYLDKWNIKDVHKSKLIF